MKKWTVYSSAAAVLVWVCATLITTEWSRTSIVRAQDGESGRSVKRPDWKTGDSWVVETETRRIQVRESDPARKPARIRWRFHVRGVEPIAGRDCYRIDIECLAKGRLQPATVIWCDKQTLFLQQFQTQLATNGRYRVIRESYSVPKGVSAPVVPPLTALPIALPAFLSQGSKGIGSFTYTSQAKSAGSKAPGLLRFAHTVQQDQSRPSRRCLDGAKLGLSKSLDGADLTEVKLRSSTEKIVQLWKKGSPWPVYTDNGCTQAWLVNE